MRSRPSDLVDADVALLWARAETLRSNRSAARSHLDVLDSCMIQGRGWGLPYAWNAFADAIANPVDTIYTYTTAAAVHAHIDYAERFAQVLPAHVSTAVEELDALWPYYDDQAKDRRPDRIVYNVNALSLAVRCRLQLPVAETHLAALLAARRERWWPYGTGQPLDRSNDMFHELLLCDGLLHIPGEPRRVAMNSVVEVWKTHLQGTGEPARDTHTLGSLIWGPAIAVVVLCRVGMRAEAAQTLAKAQQHNFYDAVHPRALAWYEVAQAQLCAS